MQAPIVVYLVDEPIKIGGKLVGSAQAFRFTVLLFFRACLRWLRTASLTDRVNTSTVLAILLLPLRPVTRSCDRNTVDAD